MESRLDEVAGQVAPAASTAAAALGELRQQIQATHVPALVKPPLVELEAQRDAVVEQLASGLGWVGLVSACGACERLAVGASMGCWVLHGGRVCSAQQGSVAAA